MIKAHEQRKRRQRRIRQRVSGDSGRPRLAVFRSNRHVSAQLIDDTQGRVLAFVADWRMDTKGKKPVEVSRELGKNMAQLAKEKKVERVVFDRSGYKYHGNVRAFAEGAREGGLEF